MMQAAGPLLIDSHPNITRFFADDAAQAQQLIETCLRENRNVQQDIRLAGKNDQPDRWIHLTLSRIENAVLQGVANDVTERKRAETAVRAIAVTDALTGLANRLGFEARLSESLQQCRRQPAERLALLLIDLDFFKQVNDTYGHDAGDRVLITVARRLQEAVRKTDFVGRLGGDEFVLLLDRVDELAVVERIAQSIVASLCQPIAIGAGREVRIGSSIGIALTDAATDNGEVILKQSDIAMYQAKQAGRNTYRFYSDGGRLLDP